MKQCTQCILPASYPGIHFNAEGVCNYCTRYKPAEYLGDEALKEHILSCLASQTDRNPDYDCVLAYSGGRDSTFLLYYLVKVLGLKVVAYSIDNHAVPEATQSNIKNITARLGVDLVIEADDHLERCIQHHLSAFMHRPSPGMVGMLCVGCRLALETRLPNFARRQKVPVVVDGSNLLDIRSFKERLLARRTWLGNESLMAGYLTEIIQNPRWLLNANCVMTQVKEYYHKFLQQGRNPDADLLMISPFRRYKKWSEKEVVSTIENELGWQKHPDIVSSWRADCEVALLKHYLYKTMLGYNEKDEGLSILIRDRQISREEALRRSQEEGAISETVVAEILSRYGLDFVDLKQRLQPVSS